MPIIQKPKGFEVNKEWPIYIGSEPRVLEKKLSVTNKYTEEVICNVSLASAKEIDEGIALAYAAREEMKKLPSFKKRDILDQIIKRIKERFEEFAYALCLEAGKPIKDARGEVQRLIETFEIASGEATRIYGEYQPLDISERTKGFSAVTKRFPIGVISMISPFNFPLNLVAHKVAPAIAAGCPFVLKPASKTPLGALMLAEILAETELPKGAFSVLPCSRDGADLFTTDERLACLSFTGSADVGWDLKAKSGKKKVILELGGNAPVIVDKDVELNHVANRIITGALYQSGQSCISVQRVIAHDHIYTKLQEILIEKVNQLKSGDPLDDETFIGPLISEGDVQRCYDWVQEAVNEGAIVLAGGNKIGKTIFEPTLICNVDPKSKVYAEEVFGPVFILERTSTFKDAVQKANNSKFGLQCGIFSNNIHHCYYAFDTLEYGGVVLNDVPSVRVDAQPYGGIKDSGLGREGIRYAIEDYTELKVLVMKSLGDESSVEQ